MRHAGCKPGRSYQAYDAFERLKLCTPGQSLLNTLCVVLLKLITCLQTTPQRVMALLAAAQLVALPLAGAVANDM